MKIVLIGYMGSGKSSIGKILSEKLAYSLVDLDDYIEKKENSTVKTIFKTKGEIYFRKKENEYLKVLLRTEGNMILSLGGGTPCYGQNMDLIEAAEDATSIYLKASLPKLSKKLFKKKAKRPLIAHIATEEDMAEFIGKHLFERSHFYNKAQITVLTDDKNKEEVATAVLEQLF